MSYDHATDSNPATLAGSFEPVPRTRQRADGWTEARQRQFIEHLAESGNVSRAAAAVGCDPSSAYRLRLAAGAQGFREAWDLAVDEAVVALRDMAMDRAINGVAVPVFHRGEKVGERRWFDHKLLMFMLRQHRPNQYGRDISAMIALEDVRHAVDIQSGQMAAMAKLARLYRDVALDKLTEVELEFGDQSPEANKQRAKFGKFDEAFDEFSQQSEALLALGKPIWRGGIRGGWKQQ